MYPSTTATFNGDLDYIAIEHAMNGEPAGLTLAERVEAARQLVARGICLAEAGLRVGCARETGAAQHGRSGYSKGCRCRVCKDGASAAQRERRTKLKAAA
jgi:hypothetical protein